MKPSGKARPGIPTVNFKRDTKQPGESSHPESNDLKIIELDPSLVDQNPLAPREIYAPETIKQRAEDLSSQGQHDAIHVIRNPDGTGRFLIADGWTRVLACKIHKCLPYLKAIIHEDMSVQDAAWFGYQQNECRSPHTDFDKAMFFDKMKNEGFSREDISLHTGVNKTLLTFYSAYSKLPNEIIELVRKHPTKFGSHVAYELQRVNEVSGRAALSLAHDFVENDLSVRKLKEKVAALLDKQKIAKKKRSAVLRRIDFDSGLFRVTDKSVELKLESIPSQDFLNELEALLLQHCKRSAQVGDASNS